MADGAIALAAHLDAARRNVRWSEWRETRWPNRLSQRAALERA